jgi:glycosyltransferase involved in cell wall biosynthesis
MKKLNSVSIVIPVYNEAASLAACLNAISRQTVRPHEVIVVDNNSSDDTVAIARGYQFVTVLTQNRQGVVYARDTGFNAATGDILGRIDADTVMAEDWVETVQKIFKHETIGAVSGRALYHDMALASVLNAIDLRIRAYLAHTLGDEVAMQGANMAVRRSAWLKVRGHVCRTGGLHEDLDLSVHINQKGHRVIFDETLVASLGYRQAESSFAKFSKYILLSPKTYALHGLKSRRYMYPVCALAIICYVPLNILHRAYDAESGRFSWTQLYAVSNPRVNPATYGDY